MPAEPTEPAVLLPGVAAAAARRRAAVLLALRYDQLVPWVAFAPAEGDAPAALTLGPTSRRLADVAPATEPLRVAADVALALTALHGAGLAHGALDATVVHLDGGPRGEGVVARLGGGGLAGLTGHGGTPAGDVRDLGLLLAALLGGGPGEPEDGRPPAGVQAAVWQVVLRLTGDAGQRPTAREAAQAIAALATAAAAATAAAPAWQSEAQTLPAPPRGPRERPTVITAEPAEAAEAAEARAPVTRRRRVLLPVAADGRAYVAPRALPLRLPDRGPAPSTPRPTLPHHDAVELELRAPEAGGLRGHGPGTVLAVVVLVAMVLLVAVLLVLVLSRG